MNCYAPLFVNVNKGAWQWPTNLIGYDAANCFGSPSYYAQSIFSKAWGDTNVAVTLEAQKVDLPPVAASQGGIGVGTWHTTAEYKDIKVTQADKTLFQSDFSTGLKGWKPTKGNWEAKDGVLAQTDTKTEPHIITGNGNWQDYTLELSAKKTGGDEGFLILFHASDKNNFLWFNIGGWGNSKSGIEAVHDGRTGEAVGESAPFTIQSNKWYNIKIECKGLNIKCFVDDKLICSATESPAKPTETLFAAASKVDATGEVILKVVNVINAPQKVEINLAGMPSVSKEASMEVLQGDPNVQNTVENPMAIAPKQGKIDDAGSTFTHEFPPDSVTVIRLKP
jgi:alpha-L-arabinofuranosidase